MGGARLVAHIRLQNLTQGYPADTQTSIGLKVQYFVVTGIEHNQAQSTCYHIAVHNIIGSSVPDQDPLGSVTFRLSDPYPDPLKFVTYPDAA